jgi:SAM-dependent methyltransferase
MLTSFSHPLLEVSAGRENLPPPMEDMTPADFPKDVLPSIPRRAKLELGRFLYPWKNKIQRNRVEHKLQEAGVDLNESRLANVITWGQKGFSQEIFLAAARRRIGQIDTVINAGCGTGYEMLVIARFLRPRKIIGLEYFNYRKAWDWITAQLRNRGIEATFHQCDLRNPLPNNIGKGDIIVSNTVLEHLRNMSESFSHLTAVLENPGWFAAMWGPMWYSYSGDHIAAELGFEKGYEHVLLPADAYLSFYKSHPRNTEYVKNAIPTWLELGLHNFARYRDYIFEIKKCFGDVQWLVWSVSSEAWRWRKTYSRQWQTLLQKNPQIQPLDLLVNNAGVLARRNTGPLRP